MSLSSRCLIYTALLPVLFIYGLSGLHWYVLVSEHLFSHYDRTPEFPQQTLHRKLSSRLTSYDALLFPITSGPACYYSVGGNKSADRPVTAGFSTLRISRPQESPEIIFILLLRGCPGLFSSSCLQKRTQAISAGCKGSRPTFHQMFLRSMSPRGQG